MKRPFFKINWIDAEGHTGFTDVAAENVLAAERKFRLSSPDVECLTILPGENQKSQNAQ